jgi:hypothetical protein
MRQQALKQAFDNNRMEVVLEMLGKSIARWATEGDLFVTPIPGLSLY